jgi:hypothetical protein
LNLGSHRFTQLVAQNKRGHVGHVYIAAELKGRHDPAS